MIQLTKHFESQQLYLASEDQQATFLTFTHLRDEESEEEHVRRLASLVTQFLLPGQYQRTGVSRVLAQDILCNLLILPIINRITDPHFLNLQCIAHLKKDNLERLNIDTERIVLNRQEEEAEQNVPSSLIDSPEPSSLSRLLQSNSVSLASILSSQARRRFLSDFLDLQGSRPLLLLWEEIEHLRRCDNEYSRKIVSKILSTYLRPVPVLHMEENILERVDRLLNEDWDHDNQSQGTEVIFEIQTEISKHIQNHFYSDFCESDFYLHMISDIADHWRDGYK